MKVLYIGHKPAYPKVDGGCVASAAFLNNLMESGCEVYYAFLSTEKHPYISDAFPQEVQKAISITNHSIETRVNRWEAVRSLFNSSSYNVERFHNETFAKKLKKILASEDIATVIFDNVFSVRYLKEIQTSNSTISYFVRTHNVEFQIWEGLSRNARNPIVRWYLKRLAKDLKRFEIRAYEKLDGIFTITNEDTQELKHLGIQTPILHVPVSVEIPDYEHNYKNKSLFHLGAMNWRPNIQAVNTVLKYLPDFLSNDPETHFTIAGLESEERYDYLDDPHVTVAGFVPSLENFVRHQGILIAPIQSGSGVRIKLLEMMAMGIPVITTTRGAQGISDQTGLLIADNKEALIDAVYTLSTDENKRAVLGIEAKRMITLYHDSKTISTKILEFLKNT